MTDTKHPVNTLAEIQRLCTKVWRTDDPESAVPMDARDIDRYSVLSTPPDNEFGIKFNGTYYLVKDGIEVTLYKTR